MPRPATRHRDERTRWASLLAAPVAVSAALLPALAAARRVLIIDLRVPELRTGVRARQIPSRGRAFAPAVGPKPGKAIDGRDSFVQWPENRTEIRAICGASEKCLRTDRDNTTRNKLDGLPDL